MCKLVCKFALQHFDLKELFIKKSHVLAASNPLRIKLLLAIGHQLQNLHLAAFKTVRIIKGQNL